MRWGETETLKFVSLYLEHEHLWNPSDPNYKRRNKRQEAYRDIISRFRSGTGILMNDVDLRIKIKSLRSTYAQELAKIKQRSGPDYVYKPSIRWFSEWHKRFNALKERSPSASRVDQSDAIDDTNQCEWLELKDLEDPIESDYYLPAKMEAPSEEEDQNSYKIKRKKLKHKKSNFIYQPPDSTVMEDEFDIYGKYIASQLRKMDLQRALRVQLDIHGIVSEARMSGLAEN